MKQNKLKPFLKRSISLGVITLCLSGYGLSAFAENNLSSLNVAIASQQQNETISGVVQDSEGEPIIGVNITIAGLSTQGTITDIDGKFTLRNVPKNSTLVFSFIGYKTKSVKAKNSLVITLEEDNKLLDDVIVVGYGTTTKRSLISSVASVKSDELSDLPVTNVTQGLAGRAPGLIVQGSGGGINKKPSISIRGGSTPLVVIDGIIRSYNDFTQLASEDIESFSILKDASATAVYGSRASDGIIQITTKRGSEGKPKIEYNFNYSISEPANWERPMDSWTRAEYANIAKQNDGFAGQDIEPAFSDERIKLMRSGEDPLQNNNVKWRDLVLNKFAPQSKHSIKMTGGNSVHNYYISLGHIYQESLYKSDNHNMKRTNFRLSESALIKSIGLRTTATIDGFLQKQTHPYSSSASGYGQVFSHIQNRNPLLPGVNKYGLPYNSSDNPVAETASDTGYNNSDNKVVNANLAFVWDVPHVQGLKLKATGNYRYGIDDNKQWRKDPAKYNWDSKEPIYDNTPLLYISNNINYTYTMQYFADYQKSFGKHHLSALAGYEETYGFTKSHWLQRENYQFPIDQINVGPESTQKNGGGESEYGRAGWIAQAKYNFDNRYFIEGSLRYDGSDNFPKDNRWGLFYAGSMGWSIADEAFMSSLVEKDIFNTLKLRVSYGQVGLDNWGSPYGIGRFEYIPSYGLNNKAWVLNGAYVPGFSEGGIPSNDITWFTTDQFDVGLDFSSLNSRLYGTVDYFYYKTTGFLYAPNQKDVGYTAPLGKSLPRVSTDGEHRRAGFDFDLGWRDSQGDFSYDVSFNFTYFDQLWANKPDEKIADLLNPYKRSSQQVGYYGNMYNNMGYYVDANDVYNSVKRLGSYNVTAGDIKYYDFNGDGKLDGADQIRTGKSNFPRGNYGLNISLNYKGFFFRTLFQGATRYDMYLSGSAAINGDQTRELPIIYDYHKDFWRPDNRNAIYPRLMANPGANGQNNYVTSDFWLINGAYLRMKDFQIGYNFDKLLKKVSWINKAVVSISGQNIFTISDATKFGLDPENSSVQHYGYPNERVYAINVSLGF